MKFLRAVKLAKRVATTRRYKNEFGYVWFLSDCIVALGGGRSIAIEINDVAVPDRAMHCLWEFGPEKGDEFECTYEPFDVEKGENLRSLRTRHFVEIVRKLIADEFDKPRDCASAVCINPGLLRAFGKYPVVLGIGQSGRTTMTVTVNDYRYENVRGVISPFIHTSPGAPLPHNFESEGHLRADRAVAA